MLARRRHADICRKPSALDGCRYTAPAHPTFQAAANSAARLAPRSGDPAALANKVTAEIEFIAITRASQALLQSRP